MCVTGGKHVFIRNVLLIIAVFSILVVSFWFAHLRDDRPTSDRSRPIAPNQSFTFDDTVLCDAITASAEGMWENSNWRPSRCVMPIGPNRTRLRKFLSDKSLLMVGDSNMERAFRQLSKLVGLTFDEHREVTRCQMHEFINVVNASTRIRPTTGEGPILFGRDNPGCTDCYTCWARTLRSSSVNFKMQLVPMEFARDVEIATDRYRTSQENFAKEFVPKAKPDFTIINVGNHDVAICEPFPKGNGECDFKETYRRNLDDYLTMLLPSTPRAMFVETAAVCEPKVDPFWKNVSTNARLAEINDAAYGVLQKHHLPLVSCFNMTMQPFAQGSFTDSHHLNDGHGLTMARLYLLHFFPRAFDPPPRVDSAAIEAIRAQDPSKLKYLSWGVGENNYLFLEEPNTVNGRAPVVRTHIWARFGCESNRVYKLHSASDAPFVPCTIAHFGGSDPCWGEAKTCEFAQPND